MNKERYRLAAKLRAEGKTFRQIGAALGVGPSRASEMVNKYAGMKRAGAHWTDGLSTRGSNLLRKFGFDSREALEAHISSNGLRVGAVDGLGRVSIAEIKQWIADGRAQK